MNILLMALNAKYIHSNLAVYSLQAYAGKYGYETGLAEFTINQQKDEILKGIFRRKPEVLCISCYIWNISYVKELITEVHKILPHTVIWLGGPEVSFDAAAVLREYPQVTGIMKGEGEQTFLDLCRLYAAYTDTLENTGIQEKLADIDGISYRSGNEIYDNPWREAMDLSEIPFVYGNLADFKNRIIYYESSRGCPFSCSYCLSSIDKKLRFRNLELVKKELQFFLEHNVSQVKFVDRTFNCNHKHAVEIWKYLIEHDNGITNFHFEIAADLLTDDEIELIRVMRPGMIQLEIGVQSTNEKTIEEIHRKMDFAKVSDVVRRVQAGHNVHQHLDLIAGLPYENYESFAHSFNDVYALQPEQLQLGFLKVLKGSYMYHMADAYGCIYQDKEPYEVLYTNWLSYEDILALKRVEEMVEVYYNSGQFTKTIPACLSLFESPFAFYEALGAFYEDRGYFDISHTRIRRYEILLEFLEQYDELRMEMYRQLMVYDLYARENMKSRPVWAKDLKPYAGQTRAFYREEAREYRILVGYKAYDEKQMARMTHLEYMDYDPDTWEKKSCIFLFDYQKRDVITGSAIIKSLLD